MNEAPSASVTPWLGSDWIIGNIQMGLIMINADGVVRLFNRWMCDRSRLSGEQVVGLKLSDVFPELQGGRVFQPSCPTPYTQHHFRYLTTDKIQRLRNAYNNLFEFNLLQKGPTASDRSCWKSWT
jgi:hypothetical protein